VSESLESEAQTNRSRTSSCLTWCWRLRDWTPRPLGHLLGLRRRRAQRVRQRVRDLLQENVRVRRWQFTCDRTTSTLSNAARIIIFLEAMAGEDQRTLDYSRKLIALGRSSTPESLTTGCTYATCFLSSRLALCLGVRQKRSLSSGSVINGLI
jgi:hypothetical protein